MALMSQMSNKKLVEQFVCAEAAPGSAHKHFQFTTKDKIPKETLKALESHHTTKRALENMAGHTFYNDAKKASAKLVRGGYLPNIKLKHGTGTEFAQSIYKKETAIQKNNKEQNIRDIQAQRRAEEQQQISTTKQSDTNNPAVTLAPAATQFKSHDHTSLTPPGEFGITKTNLKSKSKLPPPTQKPETWKKEEEEIIDLAID